MSTPTVNQDDHFLIINSTWYSHCYCNSTWASFSTCSSSKTTSWPQLGMLCCNGRKIFGVLHWCPTCYFSSQWKHSPFLLPFFNQNRIKLMNMKLGGSNPILNWWKAKNWTFGHFTPWFRILLTSKKILLLYLGKTKGKIQILGIQHTNWQSNSLL